jgi:hypothetical protein
MNDIFSVAKNLELTNTQTSNLAFANVSAFFGLGGEVRKWLAGKIFRDLPELTQSLIPKLPPQPEPALISSESLRRLHALRELAARYDSDVVLVIPPTKGRRAGTDASAVVSAGRSAGVSVLVPVEPDSLEADLYSDNGFHLNDRGAEVFTPAFVEALQKNLQVPRKNSDGLAAR